MPVVRQSRPSRHASRLLAQAGHLAGGRLPPSHECAPALELRWHPEVIETSTAYLDQARYDALVIVDGIAILLTYRDGDTSDLVTITPGRMTLARPGL